MFVNNIEQMIILLADFARNLREMYLLDCNDGNACQVLIRNI